MSDRGGRDRKERDADRAADRLLLRIARRGGVPLALLVLTTLLLAGAELALPFVLGRTLDSLIEDGAGSSWLLLVAALVAVLVAVDALDDLVSGTVVARCTAWLRHTVVEHVLAAGTRAAGDPVTGELSSRLVANAVDAGRVGPDLIRAAIAVLPAVGGTVALALIDPWLCLTFLAGLPLFVLLLRTFAREASSQATRYLDTQGKIASRLTDAISGARTIAAAGTQEREARRILEPLPDLHRHGLGMWRAQRRIVAQDAVLVSLLEVAVLAVAGALLAAGRITPGEMLAASQYVLLAAGLSSAVGFVDRLARSRAAARRMNEALALPLTVYGSEALPAGGGRLEFHGVTVRRAGRPVLDGIDLVIPAGCLAAVVGPSGSGKSLLAALAGRLADPDEGEVLLDGVPLTSLARQDLRHAVGYGFERPRLIGETVADAIAFADSPPSREEVVEAARSARADAFISRLPDGYDTPLAKAPMSGGEAQRVGLARTFATKRRLVILDDVAASLDSVTEHHISRVLTGALAGSTRLLVAHRASTAARADLVFWLEGGSVRASGTHEELWHDPGYRALFAPEEDATAGKPRAAALNGSGP